MFKVKPGKYCCILKIRGLGQGDSHVPRLWALLIVNIEAKLS
jgi:hypothetical protein